MNESIIKIDTVKFYWSKKSNFKIFVPNLEIKKGEKVLLLGESGSGKTTLLSLMCGFLNPLSGNISINQGDNPKDEHNHDEHDDHDEHEDEHDHDDHGEHDDHDDHGEHDDHDEHDEEAHNAVSYTHLTLPTKRIV